MNTRTNYEMTESDLEKILNACKPVPYMIIGGHAPSSQQENANRAWAELGERMGFNSDTVQPAPGGNRFFTAMPLEDKAPAAPVPAEMTRSFGGHKYPGCESKQFQTSDCAYGCGCWMGKFKSGGPPGVDPFGDCPKQAAPSAGPEIPVGWQLVTGKDEGWMVGAMTWNGTTWKQREAHGTRGAWYSPGKEPVIVPSLPGEKPYLPPKDHWYQSRPLGSKEEKDWSEPRLATQPQECWSKDREYRPCEAPVDRKPSPPPSPEDVRRAFEEAMNTPELWYSAIDLTLSNEPDLIYRHIYTNTRYKVWSAAVRWNEGRTK